MDAYAVAAKDLVFRHYMVILVLIFHREYSSTPTRRTDLWNEQVYTKSGTSTLTIYGSSNNTHADCCLSQTYQGRQIQQTLRRKTLGRRTSSSTLAHLDLNYHKGEPDPQRSSIQWPWDPKETCEHRLTVGTRAVEIIFSGDIMAIGEGNCLPPCE